MSAQSKPCLTFYENGQLEAEGFLLGEIQVGNWTFYFENGREYSKGHFDDSGKPIGIWTEYYENGQIKYEAISRHGNCFSLDEENVQIINYWTKDGTPQIVEGEGKLITWFENGKTEHISYWKNKVKNGTLQEFYETGELKIERFYKDGLADGIGKVFSKNGTLIYEYFYSMGKAMGKVREWYESGQLAEEGEYVNEEYFIHNFWTETGEQTLKDGTGIAIRKYGFDELDVYEQYFEKGKMTHEKKISEVFYGPFVPYEDLNDII